MKIATENKVLIAALAFVTIMGALLIYETVRGI